jgi:hypothetical protein
VESKTADGVEKADNWSEGSFVYSGQSLEIVHEPQSQPGVFVGREQPLTQLGAWLMGHGQRTLGAVGATRHLASLGWHKSSCFGGKSTFRQASTT